MIFWCGAHNDSKGWNLNNFPDFDVIRFRLFYKKPFVCFAFKTALLEIINTQLKDLIKFIMKSKNEYNLKNTLLVDSLNGMEIIAINLSRITDVPGETGTTNFD